ncbi:MAG TPA: hypothetical protein VG890_09835 [Puia sp.]|nr:hypothetical protein [Puia sp.]
MTERIKNYDSISPSAKSLLLLKGHTNIPFAKAAATLMPGTGSHPIDSGKMDFSSWARVVHFENRYWNIDQLLEQTRATNILELSSGYSFRGLDLAIRKPVHYIDTDLEPVIALKKEFIAELEKDAPPRKGILETLPLNALDNDQFQQVLNHFPPGPITIANEGLLMYLGEPEKEKLCSLILAALKARGGCWITADIYIRTGKRRLPLRQSEREKHFFEQHRVEENKFESFDAAESFFRNVGFKKEKVAVTDRNKLTGLSRLMETASGEELHRLSSVPRLQETWMLVPF